MLTRYTLERLLYRLSISTQRNRFVLKGALLLTCTMDDPYRPTCDLDLLGFGDSEPAGIVEAFREICAIEAADAVVFNTTGLTVDRIRDETEYGGLRLKTTADVDGARLRVVIDVDFGDSIEPGLVEIDLPVLLDQPAPRLRAYPYKTVIAEKFQAMIDLGRANTRMKDFYDIWVLAQSHTFDEARLARAIAGTFIRRGTEIPVELPDALTADFAADSIKQKQWAAFVRNVTINPGSLSVVNQRLAEFLMPPARAARAQMNAADDR